MAGQELALAAIAFVGRPFRLHGRDPDTGLDCIGLLAAALASMGRPVDFPTGYRMRTSAFSGLAAVAGLHGFEPVTGAIAAGDVLLTRPGPAQMHLAIAAAEPGQFIEAHAGVGRVIVQPGPLRDPILQHWRLTALA